MSSLIRRPNNATLCRFCSLTRSQQSYSTTSARRKPDTALAPQTHGEVIDSTATQLETKASVRVGVVLARPPLITRDLTPFESAFYFYQQRLNQRLALPFSRYFYYPKDTPGDTYYKKRMREKDAEGAYTGYGPLAWNDELLAGSTEDKPENKITELVNEAQNQAGSVGEESKSEDIPQPMPRRTKADDEGDLRSLNRRLDRTMYLLVQTKEGWWQFPSAELLGSETLHEAWDRVVLQSAGQDMNTWRIGQVPVGHVVSYPKGPLIEARSKSTEVEDKLFFLRGRILAGQANLKNNNFGFKDWRWLSKDEIEMTASKWYWSHVKNMLADI